MTLVIQIDSLSFPGLTEAEAARAAAVFSSHLSDLLTSEGMPSPSVLQAIARIDLGQLPQTARTPEGMGRALARRLYDRVAR